MKLSSLVISVDIAESLYDYGIRYETILFWYQEKYIPSPELFETGKSQKTMLWKLSVGKPELKNLYKVFSAFSCSELGEILPGFVKKEGIIYFFRTFRHEKDWECCYQDDNYNKLTSVSGKNETDCRGALLVNLLWNKFIDITETIIK